MICVEDSAPVTSRDDSPCTDLMGKIYDIHLQANVGQCTWDIDIKHLLN